MKKMLFGAFLWMFALAGIAVLPNYADAAPKDNAIIAGSALGTNNGGTDNSTTYDNTWDNPGGTDMITGKKQVWGQLLTTVQKTIKWILGILATVAVAICLYAWFLMMTSAGDEKKYEKGMTVLKYAAIGLAIIGLSWIIVSAVFWFINLQWWSNNTMWDVGK